MQQPVRWVCCWYEVRLESALCSDRSCLALHAEVWFNSGSGFVNTQFSDQDNAKFVDCLWGGRGELCVPLAALGRAGGARKALTTATATTEERLENIKGVHATMAAATAHSFFDRVLAILIVYLTLLRVAQHVIRLTDLFELVHQDPNTLLP